MRSATEADLNKLLNGAIDDEEPVSSKTDNGHRRDHLQKAVEHKQAAFRTFGAARIEHLYAANLHRNVAESPQGFSTGGQLKADTRP